jgi:hypothetical protein
MSWVLIVMWMHADGVTPDYSRLAPLGYATVEACDKARMDLILSPKRTRSVVARCEPLRWATDAEAAE